MNSEDQNPAQAVSPAMCAGLGMNDTHAEFLNAGRPNPHPTAGTPYSSVSLDDIVREMADPFIGEKLSGPWFIPSTYCAYDARSAKAQKDHGQFVALCFDIDEGNKSLEEVATAFAKILGENALAHIYSSSGAKPHNRKWRAIAPLIGPLSGEWYGPTLAVINDYLEGCGLKLDRAPERLQQIAFRPIRGEFYEYRTIGTQAMDADMVRDRAAEIKARNDEVAASLGSQRRQEGSRSPLRAFRIKHPTESLMSAYDFDNQTGPYWRAPNQGSGSTTSIQVYDDGTWFSLSQTFNELGIGKPTTSGGRMGDGFDLYTHYQCGGDRELAMTYAQRCLTEEDDRRYGAATVEHGRTLVEGIMSGSILVSGLTAEQWKNGCGLLEGIRLPGLAGEIANIVYEAGNRETRVFGIAAGLAAASALVSPIYALQTHPDELVSLNLYSLVLGPTTSGKEATRSAVRLALQAAGRWEEFMDGATSMPALHDVLAETSNKAPGAAFVAIDEAGINLKSINSTANGNQQLLVRGFMSLFGLSFGVLTAHKTRDKGTRIPAIERPRLALLWTSTAGKYLDAVNAEDSESGQMNRFLTFRVDKMPKKRKQRARRSLLQGHFPEPVLSKCAGFTCTSDGNEVRDPDLILRTSPEALSVFDEFEDYVEDNHIQDRPETEAESWGRAVEYCKKIAGVLAASERAARCEEYHAQLAVKIVTATVGETAALAAQAATKNIKPDSWERTETTINQLVDASGWSLEREVKKRLRFVDDREKLLRDMEEAGIIERVNSDSGSKGGRPKAMVRVVT